MDVHHMQSFLQPFHEELALALFARLEPSHIVRRADPAIHARTRDGHHGTDESVRSHACEAQRIIQRLVVIGAGNVIRAGRQDEFRLHVVDAEAGTAGRGVLGENLDAEELVEETDVPRNHHQRGNGRHLEIEVNLHFFHPLKVDAHHLEVELCRLQLGRQFRRGSDLLIDGRGLRQHRLQFGLGNDLRALLKRRRDHRELHRDGFAIQHKAHLELDRAEILLINHDPPLPNLVVSQGPGRDPRHQHLIEHPNGHAGRRPLQPHRPGDRIHQPDLVQLIISDEIERRQQQRTIHRPNDAPRIKRRPMQHRLDISPQPERCRCAIGNTPADQFHQHRTSDTLGHRDNRWRNA